MLTPETPLAADGQGSTTAAAPENGGGDSPPAGASGDGRFAVTARVVFIVLSLVAASAAARAVVVPALLAWVLAMVLRRPVDGLRHLGLSAPSAAGVVVAAALAMAGWGVVHLGHPAIEWLSAAPENLPALRQKFRHILRPAARITEAASSVGKLTEDEPAAGPPPVVVKEDRVASTVFTWTGSALAGIAETVALLFLLLASGDHFLHKLVKVLPRLREKKRVVEISRQIHQQVGAYVAWIGLINLVFGAAVGLALHWLGMPNAPMWGAVAAVANFIPYFGSVIGIGAVSLGGLLAFDTLEMAFLPAAIYGLFHLIEANLVTPCILGRRFSLNPVVVFLTLVFLTWLWGPIGALLAFPLLMALKVVVERLPELAGLAEVLGDDSRPSRRMGWRRAPSGPATTPEPTDSVPPSTSLRWLPTLRRHRRSAGAASPVHASTIDQPCLPDGRHSVDHPDLGERGAFGGGLAGFVEEPLGCATGGGDSK